MDQVNVMREQEIKQKLKTFIKDNFLLGNDSNLNDDDSFMGKGIVDSTGILEVVSFVEAIFNLRVEDQELMPENLDSINNLLNFIKAKLTKSI